MAELAPVVLFVYNRPDHTRRTLAALAANPLAIDSELIIYADGAKRSEHQASVLAVRDLVRSTKGFKSIEIVERQTNFGLANSIISGVSEICGSHGRVIVVEDDLVVSPKFLTFLNAGLNRYENDESVLQISGYSFPVQDRSTPGCFFLPMSSCWGWATWSRAWSHFDPAMTQLPQLDQDRSQRIRFNVDGAYDYYGMACQQRKGKIDSWGIRWQLSLFANNGLVLYPKETLVTNIGVDNSGTHGAGEPAYQVELSKHSLEMLDFSWPAKVEINNHAFDQVRRLLHSTRPALLRRALHWVLAWR